MYDLKKSLLGISIFKLGLSQSEEISSDLCCLYGGGISHNEDALFSKVYCCLILNYPTPIEIWIWRLVVRALIYTLTKLQSSKFRSVSSVKSGESHRSVGSVNISLDFDEKPAAGK